MLDAFKQTINKRRLAGRENPEPWLVRYTFHLTLFGIVATALVATLGIPGPIDGLVFNYGQRVENPDATLKVAAGLAAAFLAVAALGRYELTRMGHGLATSGQITERFVRAVEMLSSDSLDTRLGGIYSLERVAKDSPSDAQTVFDVLCAFLREHTPNEDQGQESPDISDESAASKVATDIQAAVTVISRSSDYLLKRRIDLQDVNLAGAKLSSAYLLGADLLGANLSGATMVRANLSGATLVGTDLSGANLVEAKLTGANLYEANLTGTKLAGADLLEATLYEANLTRANLSGANLTRAKLRSANLSGAKLSEANLYEADLSGAKLTRAKLYKTNLTRADLTGAGLDDANLTKTNLAEAGLSRANLTGANLSGANLTGAYLGGAKLTGAYLSGAKLTGAYLSGADLGGAYLTGATLTGATLGDANLSEAIWDPSVPPTWPDGYDPGAQNPG